MVEATLQYSLIANGVLSGLIILMAIVWAIFNRMNKSDSIQRKRILQLMREHHDNQRFLFSKMSKYLNSTTPQTLVKQEVMNEKST